MVKLPCALVGAGELSDETRLRLVASLFGQWRSVVEGTIAQIVTMAIFWRRTGLPIFGMLIVCVLLVFAGRLWQRKRYLRDVSPGRRPTRSPDEWARRFVAGAAASGFMWSLTTAAVCLRPNDTELLFFNFMIQAGWVSGSTVRNSASPAAVLAQACVTILPSIPGSLLSSSGLMHFIALFAIIQIKTVLDIAGFAAQQAVVLLSSEQKLAAANVRLETLSATDGLTGIANRRAFDAAVKSETARAARERAPLALLLIDVDHFKRYNDTYGHLEGDECLRMIAATVEAQLRRPPDIAARFGGEEFVCLLPGTAEEGACEAAERLRAAIAETALLHAGSPLGIVTASIGVAAFVPEGEQDGPLLVGRADRALYEAKAKGRNRVCAAGAAEWQSDEPSVLSDYLTRKALAG